MMVESADGTHALLGRSRGHRPGMLTCLSGFIDQAESIGGLAPSIFLVLTAPKRACAAVPRPVWDHVHARTAADVSGLAAAWHHSSTITTVNRKCCIGVQYMVYTIIQCTRAYPHSSDSCA
jgi:hypothetical protein